MADETVDETEGEYDAYKHGGLHLALEAALERVRNVGADQIHLAIR